MDLLLKRDPHHRTVSTFQQPLLKPVPTIGIIRTEILVENRIQDYIAGNVTGNIVEGQSNTTTFRNLGKDC